MTRDELVERLKNGRANITFTKKDGTERVINCTLDRTIAIPHERKTDRVKVIRDEILPVWDIDLAAWRSITIDNIKSFEDYEQYTDR